MGVNINDVLFHGVKLDYKTYVNDDFYEKHESLMYDTYKFTKDKTKKELCMFFDGMGGDYIFVGIPEYVGGDHRYGDNEIDEPIEIKTLSENDKAKIKDFLEKEFQLKDAEIKTYLFGYYH